MGVCLAGDLCAQHIHVYSPNWGVWTRIPATRWVYGWVFAVAEVVEGDDGYYGSSRDGGHICFLSHGEDDRQRWICTGAANVRAIQRIELNRGEE